MRRSKPGTSHVEIGGFRSSVREMNAHYARKSHERLGMVDHGTIQVVSKDGGAHASKKTQSLINEVLDRVRHGETIRNICKDPHMPHYTTFWDWVTKDNDLRQEYYKAKQDQADYFAEQILEIADESSTDIIESFDKNGRRIPIVNYENIKRSELRVRARQWLMERVQRERYNEKLFVARQESELQQQQQGPVKATIEIVLPDNGRQVLEVEGQNIKALPV